MKPRKSRGQICTSRHRVTAGMLLSFLAISTQVAADKAPGIAIDPWYPVPGPKPPNVHDFTLRHIFHRGTYQDPDLHKRYDLHPQAPVLVAEDDGLRYSLQDPPHFTARSHSMEIERLVNRQPYSIERHLQYARLTGNPAILDASDWTMDEVNGPNISDKDTVLDLAIMAADAYAPVPGEGDWEDVSRGYNQSIGFGWEGDGLRGHIFADQNNETVIISLKGTSPAVFDGDGTTTKDKLNDNLFFSCCCAQGGQYFWRQVCDCYSSTYTCNQTCLVKALRKENRYYRASIDLYTNVTELYPDSNVWLVGHSLGGAVTSLLGLTFGLPTVTFEAPGDDLAAKRLGLPFPPSSDPYKPRTRYTGAFHFGNTADPVFMGTCNGATATCTLGGYAMESQCHTGHQCVYDTVGDYGWRVGIGNHKIRNVIESVIKVYPDVPSCSPDDECVDCFNWKYFESNGSDPTTSSTTTTTSTRTRTTTCKTPGWWGCLDDESSTTTTSTPIITTTYTTTSCATPGWFGCNKGVNVTITTTTVAPTVTTTTSSPASHHTLTTPSSSCQHPGWWGCRDPTTTQESSPSPASSQTIPTRTAKQHTCQSPGFFFGCRDRTVYDSTIPTTRLITEAPILTASTAQPSITQSNDDEKGRGKCRHHAFFGLICLDQAQDIDTIEL
ncbi:uncharacterized protein Z518_08230 [Rhinocladiella mackenziei CBS 650.93]|uniref:Putative lipase ATG15 n=1 Tax=Rhinocladiella mackenziei CBS 650.93 TaxID=1442369 RepID=A0A0D2IG96_9EURO|nr:uncharacterized protein Z518_08230 [Rhinocladiella mackenziei CBS 650.93]KIX02291.1 hypothetical protein Z518_08230 [Rhinocladiella mackenziei CBS 650.93]